MGSRDRTASERSTTAVRHPRCPPTPLSPAATTLTSNEAHNFSTTGVLSSWHFALRGRGPTHPTRPARAFGACDPQPPLYGARGPRAPHRAPFPDQETAAHPEEPPVAPAQTRLLEVMGQSMVGDGPGFRD